MSAFVDFNRKYKYDYLVEYYFRKIKYKCAPGIDKINSRRFEKNLTEYISIISSKVINDSYRFTSYKERLIPKDRNKKPRLISIPTIRDKVTLGVLKEILVDAFKFDVNNKIVQTIIGEVVEVVKDPSSGFDCFFKLDIENFYGSLDQNILFKKIRKRVRKEEILNLISKAI
jgi:RNA-directed DNA polymerase